MMNTKLSILVLSYNHSAYIEACVLSCIAQKTASLQVEVVIIDDGSNDGTKQVLERLEFEYNEIKVYYQEHSGVTSIAKNFNKLISFATGDYVTFISSDDEQVQGIYPSLISKFSNDQNLQFIYCNGINKENGFIKKKVIDSETMRILGKNDPVEMYGFVLCHIPLLFIQGIVVRKSFFTNFLPFDEDLIADDWVFNIRCFKRLIETHGHFMFIDEVAFIRNKLPNRTSADFPVHWLRIKQVVYRYVPEDRKWIVIKKFLSGIIRRLIRKKRYGDCMHFILILLIQNIRLKFRCLFLKVGILKI